MSNKLWPTVTKQNHFVDVESGLYSLFMCNGSNLISPAPKAERLHSALTRRSVAHRGGGFSLCATMSASKVKIEIGQRFGRLVVLEPSFRSKNNSRTFLCQCDCGNKTVAIAAFLPRGMKKSCGCLKIETSILNGKKGFKHGRTKYNSPTYSTWISMRSRCAEDSTGCHWKSYGAKGIMVCEQWNSFENFLSDMGERPQGKTIDRINPNGNYEPSNCRWATPKQQIRNRSKVKTLTMGTETRPLMEWSEITGIKYTTINERLKHGWSVERSLSYV